MRVVPGTEHAVFAGDTHVGSSEATIVLADASGSLALLDELIEDLVELQLPGPNRPTAPAGRRAPPPGSLPLCRPVARADR
jgi:hypothetical protein